MAENTSTGGSLSLILVIVERIKKKQKLRQDHLHPVQKSKENGGAKRGLGDRPPTKNRKPLVLPASSL
jgi:hypothetical protein